METVFALASAPGRAGISVIRITGPDSHAVVMGLCGGLPEVRKASVRSLIHQGEVLDQALILVFNKGQSFTGEDSAEFHVHGSTAVVRRVLAALSSFPNCRLAEAGEFTRRALENGCIDLVQVEGLADLIDAETEAQRSQALRVMSGALSERVSTWRNRLIRAAALIEATIDFADEEVPQDVTPEVLEIIGALRQDLQTELQRSSAAERVREGFEVAIIGSPNVGKSTLLNLLAGREAAITSEIAGTTRDVIEVRMEIAGFPVTLLDTAGVRDSDDPVEKIGIARARQRGEGADLRIFLLESAEEAPALAARDEDILVVGKADLTGSAHGVSGLTGQGVDLLMETLAARLQAKVPSQGLLIRERHRTAIHNAMASLDLAIGLLHPRRASPDAELVALHLRNALRCLEVMIGRVDVDTLLGEIFSSFCIGK